MAAGGAGVPQSRGAVVVVAARAAAREIPRVAAAWALAHVARHGDAVMLLVLMPPPPPATSGTIADSSSPIISSFRRPAD
jgi:hypothetical protein